MKRMLGAAVAAVVLSYASAVSADVVVFHDLGSTDRLDLYQVPLSGPGTYRFELASSLAMTFGFEGGYTYHWDTFVAPAPKPHDQFIEGNTAWQYFNYSATGTTVSWTFVVPETQYIYFNAPNHYEVYGVAEGTLVYRENKYESPYFSVFGRTEDRDMFDYDFSITKVSAVPEPATWAMLIVGFALVGSAVRARRLQAA